ncbi:MAG: NAD(P)H-dependent oxidoreductase subunit E [Oscillospiraceae bacterium]|nr:NAD(P)H-dependent oxidoreductase subunit E [Oscillospiraceae bacterium]
MKPFVEVDEAMTLELAQLADRVIAKHDHDSTQLVGILLDIQDEIELHYIPKPVAFYLAEQLDLKLTQIWDVLSFYSSLYTAPRAKYPIQICDSVVCRVNDSGNLYAMLRDILNIDLNEVTYDHKFTLEKVPCFGACDMAPAARVNGRVFGHLTTRERVIDMLNSLD